MESDAFDRLVAEWLKAQDQDTGDPPWDSGYSEGLDTALETLFPDQWPPMRERLVAEAVKRRIDALRRRYPKAFKAS